MKMLKLYQNLDIYTAFLYFLYIILFLTSYLNFFIKIFSFYRYLLRR